MVSDRRQKMLVIAAVVCLAALGGDRFVVTPLSDLWNARSKRIAELGASLAKGSLLVDRAQQVRERWDEIKTHSLMREPSAAESQVLGAVSKWTGESNLNVTSLKPRWLLDEKDSRTLEFRLTASGSLASISRFLYALETDPLALRVEDVEMASRDPRGGELTLAVRFTGLMLVEGGS